MPPPQQQQAGLQTLSEGPEEGDGGPEGHQGHRHIVGEVNARRRARNGPRKVRTCRMSHRMVCLRLSHFRRDLVQVAQGQTLPETRLGIRAAAQHSRHRPAGAQHAHFDGKFLLAVGGQEKRGWIWGHFGTLLDTQDPEARHPACGLRPPFCEWSPGKC